MHKKYRDSSRKDAQKIKHTANSRPPNTALQPTADAAQLSARPVGGSHQRSLLLRS
jgi:hypothetical protein